MNRQQAKAAKEYQLMRERYIAHAHENRGHIPRGGVQEKALEAAENNLIVAFYGDDPLWTSHGVGSGSLRHALELAKIESLSFSR